jgi:CRP/FNR family cyclic AMP-dependent transcriptional regulator
VSKAGREATIAILSEGEFFGEGALAGQALRMGSAAAMTDCQLLRIEKKAMMSALPWGTRFLRYVRGVFAGPEHPL